MDTAVFDGNLADYTVTGSPDGSQSIVTEIATGFSTHCTNDVPSSITSAVGR